MASIKIPALRKLTSQLYKQLVPGISQPNHSTQSLQRAVEELKMGHEQLVRGRGDKGLSALLVQEFDISVRALVAVLDARYVVNTDATGTPEVGLPTPDPEDLPSPYVPAGYGGVYLPEPISTFPNLDNEWRTVIMSEGRVTEPRGLDQLPEDNALRITVAGVWTFAVTIAFQHDSSNAGRLVWLRLFNISKQAGSTPIPIGIGRNVESTSFSVSTLVETDDDLATAGDKYILQLGNGDAVAVDSFDFASLSLTYASEFRG